jgi:hypothetical protein
LDEQSPGRVFYEGFQRAEFERWDGVIAEDVTINSPSGYGMTGLTVLKDWAANFARLGYRIDLVDEHLALDNAGNGRGFVTCLLHWKHVADFLGLAPTGREGTSIETMIFTIDNGVIARAGTLPASQSLSSTYDVGRGEAEQRSRLHAVRLRRPARGLVGREAPRP